MGNLCIDIGNSRAKVALFREHELVEQWAYPIAELPCALRALLVDLSPAASAVSCVSGVNFRPLLLPLKENSIPYHLAGVGSVLPFHNGYARAEQLGVDRLCALVGGYGLFPGVALVVADAGTALTLDYISPQGYYEGGFISPGMHMRSRALHEYTHGLPLIDPSEGETTGAFSLGCNTHTAISGGIVEGMLAEIEHFARECAGEKALLPKVILTGGDGEFLHNRANFLTFAVGSLVLQGLDALLDYNPCSGC